MDKLYPPIIGDKLPGFQNDNNSVLVSVPFENNRSVGYGSIYSMVLRLKTVQTDSLVLNCLPTITDVDSETGQIKESVIKVTKVVHFNIPSNMISKLNYGQFQKLQLAYIETGATSEDWQDHIGYYSNVGMSKYTSKPTIYIDGLTSGDTHQYNYIGRYSQRVPDIQGSPIFDTTEKVYQYKFTITGTDINIDSGWLIHDSNNDENEYSSYDSWEYLQEISDDCQIKYSVLTNSGINFDSVLQTIVPGGSSGDTVTVKPHLNFYDGYIDIFIEDAPENNPPAQSDCYVLRKNIKTNEIINLGKVQDSIVGGNKVIRDFTFEQGLYYSYAIQEKNENTNVRYAFCDPIYGDFEDIFLYDGERQLKIRFNPSVSGIHYTIPESKQDTIGGKYPVFFRNGNVKYRDFTLNGLISFQMDENRLFSEYGVADQPSRERTYTTALDNSDPPKLHSFVIPTDLVGENFYHERMFREEVLEWLNDGKLKLFRSSSEGIMIVKTMNVNMTPEQTPSRMIYNFSCQMYEATGHEYEDLVKANIINRD